MRRPPPIVKKINKKLASSPRDGESGIEAAAGISISIRKGDGRDGDEEEEEWRDCLAAILRQPVEPARRKI